MRSLNPRPRYASLSPTCGPDAVGLCWRETSLKSDPGLAMPTAARRVPVVSQPDAVSRRQPIRGIKNMPSGYDAEVAELFRDLRAATALSRNGACRADRDPPEVVEALEQGALQPLPPWAETCRVVNAYGVSISTFVRFCRIYAAGRGSSSFSRNLFPRSRP